VVTAGYVLGLPSGPRGVACGFSEAKTLLTVPLTEWRVRGTVVSFRDVLGVVSCPLISGIIATLVPLRGNAPACFGTRGILHRPSPGTDEASIGGAGYHDSHIVVSRNFA
jgi:hypothetical protein